MVGIYDRLGTGGFTRERVLQDPSGRNADMRYTRELLYRGAEFGGLTGPVVCP
jgi:hypothetical protein